MTLGRDEGAARTHSDYVVGNGMLCAWDSEDLVLFAPWYRGSLRSPPAIDSTAQPEPIIRRSLVSGSFFAPSDDGKNWEYVSEEWVLAWLTRCEFFGIKCLMLRARRLKW